MTCRTMSGFRNQCLGEEPAWMKQADRKALDIVARLEHEILELRAAVDKPDRDRMRTFAGRRKKLGG